MLRAVEGDAVAEEAIEMTVLAGEDHRPAGAADRVADITFLKQHALARNPIHVRCGIDLGTVGTDGVRGVVVGKDKENVGAFGGGGKLQSQIERQNQEDTFHDWYLQYSGIV